MDIKLNASQFDNEQPHQIEAVDAVLSVLRHAETSSCSVNSNLNPVLRMRLASFNEEVAKQQQRFLISEDKRFKAPKRILDIEMETGTGKTYTLTRTMFELHKVLDLAKFVVIVPTLAIKSQMHSFWLDDSRSHFENDYGTAIRVHVVKAGETGVEDDVIPPSVQSFIDASAVSENEIHILLLNAGMLNSPTFAEEFYVPSFDEWMTPKEAISFLRPVVVIDEPHRIPIGKTTWDNLVNLSPQAILRYGATFEGKFQNLIYSLDAEQAVDRGLVKTVQEIAFGEWPDMLGKLKLIRTYPSGIHEEIYTHNGLQSLHEHKRIATFVYFEGGQREVVHVKDPDLGLLHPSLSRVSIDKVFETHVALSNGLRLPIGQSIDPNNSSLTETYEDSMLRRVVSHHFDIEKRLLTKTPRIKPFTLIFIGEIGEYRDENWSGWNNWLGRSDGFSFQNSDVENRPSLRERFEQMVWLEAATRLETETDSFYRDYLAKTLRNISRVHGGYFAQDNWSKNENILRQREEILHDKQALLSLDNPRRFIFSKWALKEGWDNPNVFQVCKIRRGGSLTSNRQELGRGLRLPMDEKMKRVKSNVESLHYFIDRSEEMILTIDDGS